MKVQSLKVRNYKRFVEPCELGFPDELTWKDYYTFAIKEIDFTKFEDFKQLLDLVKS